MSKFKPKYLIVERPNGYFVIKIKKTFLLFSWYVYYKEVYGIADDATIKEYKTIIEAQKATEILKSKFLNKKPKDIIVDALD